MQTGYYRFPTIHEDTVVFVCEDDLWSISAAGGVHRRLTSGLAAASHPALSPDGGWLVFTGREEGQSDVYLMPAAGGPAERRTWTGGLTRVVGWHPDGRVVYASNEGQPFKALFHLYALDLEGGPAQRLPTGPAISAAFGPGAACAVGTVIGRLGMSEPACWKRYRGGTTGDLWIDAGGSGDFRRLIDLPGNLASPLWVGGRIFFVSDHEGTGNLYSCLPSGEDLKRHTDHGDFYVRSPASDGKRIAYHAGADLFLYDPTADRAIRIDVDGGGPRTQRQRKFVDAANFLEDWVLHPAGHSLALGVRGKVYTLGNREGPVRQLGAPDGVRYRLARWLPDGERVVVVSDESGEDAIEVHRVERPGEVERLDGLDIGRPLALCVAPRGDRLVLANHRNELILVDLAGKGARLLDRSAFGPIEGLDIAPDGRWAAYGYWESRHTVGLRICDLDRGTMRRVTEPILRDAQPRFDPEGRYLYFLSHRVFDPVYDEMRFDLGFPNGVTPCLLTLRRDLPSPLVRDPAPPGSKEPGDRTADAGHGSDAPCEPVAIEIDFDGIERRVVALPVPPRRYHRLAALPGKLLLAYEPVQGSRDVSWFPADTPPARSVLECFDFAKGKAETLLEDITDLDVSGDRKTMVVRTGNRLRVLKAAEKPEPESADDGEHDPDGGWVDLARLRVSVEPQAEWRQMFREAWRLQRDHFWTPDMSSVDWPRVFEQYRPLLDRVATRGELSDLLWEVFGELGTSHAYEFGGDYRASPQYAMGFLGADLVFDRERGLWRIQRIVRGDPWDEAAGSPLARAGVRVEPGDTILAVGGQPVDARSSPQRLLVHQAASEVFLTVGDGEGKNPRPVRVKTLADETPARYRDWVESRRSEVHRRTGGRIGYVHVPDMGPRGYAEFYRGFLPEIDRQGLIVDVRYNGGGHVSTLVLEQLARRRFASIRSRWSGVMPHPEDSVAGPVVAITNQYAGSDGDVFSHGFKLLGLGPLVGKRTWGGVVGIHLRERLVDGTITTQPEFSTWFPDVGYGIENRGVEPDIDVEFRPQDYVAGRDPQLDIAVDEALRLLDGYSMPEPPEPGASALHKCP